MRVAYADPPYIGQAKRHYGKHSDFRGEVNYKQLVDRLIREFPDGWALSLSAQTLQHVLNFCPAVRVLVWVKRYHGMLPGIRLQYCWEPVLLYGCRQSPHRTGETTVRDWVLANPEGFTFRTMPADHVIGKKPREFCYWLFDVMDLEASDELVDLFPGTGAVAHHWSQWKSQGHLFRKWIG